MSNLKAYYAFMELVKKYLQLGPPRIPLGEYLTKHYFTSEEKGTPTRFKVQDDNGLFLTRLKVQEENWTAGLVTSLEVSPHTITVTIFGTTLIEKRIPISRLTDFEYHKPQNEREIISTIVQQMEKEKESQKPEGDRHGCHFTANTESNSIQC